MNETHTAKVTTGTGTLHSAHETYEQAAAAAERANAKAAEMGLTVTYAAAEMA